MIVFIAMVLVAGIAASVLVQTANKLEMQAMVTGEETTSEVATGLTVFDIEGHVSSSVINYLAIAVKPRAGSMDIDLEQTVIELCNGSKKVLLTYYDNETWDFASNVSAYDGRVFSTNTISWNMSNEEFGIIVIEDADTSCLVGTPVINRGDTVLLCINTANCFTGASGLSAREDIWGQVIPEEGSFGVFSFRVPTSLSDTVYDLY
jgi:flagellin FlaB